MDDLKTLLELVSKLPQMALWVALGFWAYKVVIVGSIFGVARLAIIKVHSALTMPKHELVKHDVRLMLDGEVITGAKEALAIQLGRLKGRGVTIDSPFVHAADVDWLRQAIDEKIERQTQAKKVAA